MSLRKKWLAYFITLVVIASVGYYFRLEVMEWYYGTSLEKQDHILLAITVGVLIGIILGVLPGVINVSLILILGVLSGGIQGIIWKMIPGSVPGFSFVIIYTASFLLTYSLIYLIRKSL